MRQKKSQYSKYVWESIFIAIILAAGAFFFNWGNPLETFLYMLFTDILWVVFYMGNVILFWRSKFLVKESASNITFSPMNLLRGVLLSLGFLAAITVVAVVEPIISAITETVKYYPISSGRPLVSIFDIIPFYDYLKIYGLSMLAGIISVFLFIVMKKPVIIWGEKLLYNRKSKE